MGFRAGEIYVREEEVPVVLTNFYSTNLANRREKAVETGSALDTRQIPIELMKVFEKLEEKS